MGVVSIWIMVISMLASAFMGLLRSVERGAIFSAILSYTQPFYGLVYFFAAKSGLNTRST
jgi:hypothetical protein